MNIRLLLSFGAVLVMVSCGKETSQPKDASQRSAPVAQAPAARTAGSSTIVANNYSGGGYTAGVHSQPGAPSFFYFLINPDSPVPVKVGSTLLFSKTGRATVTKIDLAAQGGKTAVFVHVDKTLDPAGDGFPNPIGVQ